MLTQKLPHQSAQSMTEVDPAILAGASYGTSAEAHSPEVEAAIDERRQEIVDKIGASEVPEDSLAARLIDLAATESAVPTAEQPAVIMPREQIEELADLRERADRGRVGARVELLLQKLGNSRVRMALRSGIVDDVQRQNELKQVVPEPLVPQDGVLDRVIVPLDKQFTPTSNVPHPTQRGNHANN